MSGQCAWFMTDLATEPDQGAIHLSGTPAESMSQDLWKAVGVRDRRMGSR